LADFWGYDEVDAQELPGTWRELLASWGLLLVRDLAEYPDILARITPAERATGWFGTEPATDHEIAALEERLGLNLPPSYAEFLRTTNGFSSPEVELLPADRVALFSQFDPEWFGIWMRGDPAGGNDMFTTLPKTIVVATMNDGDDLLLLNPTIIDERGEWAAWPWWKEGVDVVYRSFRDAIAAAYVELRDDVEEAD
jgi:hypothetical protein